MSGIFIVILATAFMSSIGLQVHEECSFHQCDHQMSPECSFHKRGEVFELQFNDLESDSVCNIDVDECDVSIEVYRKVYLDDKELSVDIYRKCDAYNLDR